MTPVHATAANPWLIWQMYYLWQMYIIIALVAIVWLGCGYVSGAGTYAYFQREFPLIAPKERSSHRRYAFFGCALGILSLIINLADGEFEHGFCWNWIMKPDLAASSQSGLVTYTNGGPCVGCGNSTAIRTSSSGASAPICLSCTSMNVHPGTPGWAATYKVKYTVTPPPARRSAAPSEPLPSTTSTEPIVGYRVWRLKDGRLQSTYMTDYFWPMRRRLTKDGLDNRGVHAVKNSDWLHQQYTNLAHSVVNDNESLWDTYQADVAGEVYLWGAVQENEFGYLAEYAYPKQLWMPEDTDPLIVMELEENYGVPVSLRKEFRKARPSSDLAAAPPGQRLFFYNPMTNANPLTFPLTVYAPCSLCGQLYDTSLATCPCQQQNATLAAMMQQQQNQMQQQAQQAARQATLNLMQQRLYNPAFALPPAPSPVVPDPSPTDPSSQNGQAGTA